MDFLWHAADADAAKIIVTEEMFLNNMYRKVSFQTVNLLLELGQKQQLLLAASKPDF